MSKHLLDHMLISILNCCFEVLGVDVDGSDGHPTPMKYGVWWVNDGESSTVWLSLGFTGIPTSVIGYVIYDNFR